MDQCKSCVMSGDFDGCIDTPCSYRETWIFREAVEQAHMRGQIDGSGGMFDPSYSQASYYFDRVYVLGEHECMCGQIDEAIKPTDDRIIDAIVDNLSIRGIDIEDYRHEFNNQRSGIPDAIRKLFVE